MHIKLSMPSLPVALTIAFVVLKLTGVIAWSWWWVISPVLAVVGVWLVLLMIILGAVAARNK